MPPCSGQLQRQSWPSRLAQPSALAMSAALMGPAVSADRDSERHPCGGAGRAFWNSAGKVFALLGLLLPSFRIGLVLSLVFSVYLGWLVVTPPCRFGLNVRTLGEGVEPGRAVWREHERFATGFHYPETAAADLSIPCSDTDANEPAKLSEVVGELVGRKWIACRARHGYLAMSNHSPGTVDWAAPQGPKAVYATPYRPSSSASGRDRATPNIGEIAAS